MPTQISTIEALVRETLEEPVPRFWSSAELTNIIAAGIKDLWRSVCDLKEEYFLVVNDTDVFIPQGGNTILGVPNNVHKVYLIEARDLSENSPNQGLRFEPLDYNHPKFRSSRTETRAEPSNQTVFYAITGQGNPVNAPTIYVAPSFSSAVNLSFSYVPGLGELTTDHYVPIPGEADNALKAWGIAYARAKEREDRAPDPTWISIYATEKSNLMASLGLRQLQEPKFVDAVFEEYWP